MGNGSDVFLMPYRSDAVVLLPVLPGLVQSRKKAAKSSLVNLSFDHMPYPRYLEHLLVSEDVQRGLQNGPKYEKGESQLRQW